MIVPSIQALSTIPAGGVCYHYGSSKYLIVQGPSSTVTNNMEVTELDSGTKRTRPNGDDTLYYPNARLSLS